MGSAPIGTPPAWFRSTISSMKLAETPNSRFQFQKRGQYFVRVHNESLSVAVMCICNPDCSPVGIHA
jgi:hypothetical protein